ncbi:MAG: dihydroorotate dehydrogenase electron transfer subunit, partial [Dehalococcoidia bacterium]|nr:dihydroorotate dehydrogenase electron transfer subunit [Dehalococcoidia bacterium]
KVNVIGPLGNGFKVAADTKRLLIVAGGIGIAPLGFLATQALSTGRQVTLLLGARSAANILPENMLPSEATCAITTDDGSSGKKGLVIDILPEYLEGADQIFACGPQAMLEKLAKIPEIQSKPVQVSLEVRMGCGAGACYGCSIRTTHGMKRVCREGPVFDIKDIIWQEVSI